MSDSSADLRQKLNAASDLHEVVRTMKAMAASSIGTYEQSVRALAGYDRAVKLGLALALRDLPWETGTVEPKKQALKAIVFGSDQGLVGQFNDVIAEFAIETLAKLPGPAVVWAVGQRVHARLADAGLAVRGLINVPNDVGGIAGIVGYLQLQTVTPGGDGGGEAIWVFHNRQSNSGVYEPTSQRLLPLDRAWRDAAVACRWPTNSWPEMLGDAATIARALVGESIFISLFQACTESLASENATRLAAMLRAEKNIDELTEELTRRFHRVRQTCIDEGLFDVISGAEALNRAR